MLRAKAGEDILNEVMPFGAGIHAAVQPLDEEMIRPLADAGVGTRASASSRKTLPMRIGSAQGAQLRISALGLYRCFINGVRVGNDLLTPGWTAYDQRLSFQTYDVSGLLKAGENVIDIWLADGWYRSQMMWTHASHATIPGAREIAAIAELTGGDGKVLLATDATWRSGLLPILKSGIYFGEIFDARGLDHADRRQGHRGARRFRQRNPAIRTRHEPVQGTRRRSQVQESWSDAAMAGRSYDFGQNAAGYVAFTVRGDAGAKVRVEFAEILDRDRNIDNANYRSAECHLEYVLKGDGEESYRPFFTFFGFRYARITIEGKAKISSIVSVPISSAGQPAAAFSSGHKLVNRLVENTLWSLRSNFIEAPTDCPQRDERLGWTGDAQVFAPTACYLNDSERISAENGCAT